MKFSIEIEGDNVKYSYEVGLSKVSAETQLGVNWMVAFTECLKLASDAWSKTLCEKHETIKREGNK